MNLLVEKYGDIQFFALVRRSVSFNSWDILLVAPWAQSGDSKLVRYIDTILKRTLRPSENAQIGSIFVKPANDPFLNQFVLRLGEVSDQAQVHLTGPLFDDEHIIEAYVLAAHRAYEQRTPTRARKSA